jgi:hypothetical protein
MAGARPARAGEAPMRGGTHETGIWRGRQRLADAGAAIQSSPRASTRLHALAGPGLRDDLTSEGDDDEEGYLPTGGKRRPKRGGPPSGLARPW